MLTSFPTDNASVESAWREALAIRDLGYNARAKSQRRLAQAHAVRIQAESEAITATKNYCVDLRVQADRDLRQAELTLAQAERIKVDAQSWVDSMKDEIQFRLDDAASKQANARSYAEKLEDTARGAADALLGQTRAGAEELASRMRRESAEDIRKILADIEVARAAAEDELEAQRLLTETARVRAFTVGLNIEDARNEPVKFTVTPQVAKPAKPTASVKKRTTNAKARTIKPTPIRAAKPRPARKAA